MRQRWPSRRLIKMYSFISMIMKTIFSVFAVLAAANIVVALPYGSPVCTVGSAAPSSLHLSRSSIQTGGLSIGGLKVFIGDNELDNGLINSIIANKDLQLHVSGADFKGVLVILNKDGTDLSSSLTTNSPLLQTQSSCPSFGYGGFTHTSRDLKKSVDATINMPSNLDAFLDVNVVVMSNVTGSTYYHTRYMLSTVPATTSPTNSPTNTPRNAPRKVPTTAPHTRTPTRVPRTRTPTRAPRTRRPTRAPTGTSINVTPTNCHVVYKLFNSRTDLFVANLSNRTTITTSPPCARTNIQAIVPCGDSDNWVMMELYQGNELIHRRVENSAPYFLFGNNRTNVYDGQIARGTYRIRAKVNGVFTPFTRFALQGPACS